MSFLVEGFLDDHTLSVTTATAKEAFAKAIEWHDSGRFSNVTISDGTDTHSIVSFPLAMACAFAFPMTGDILSIDCNKTLCRCRRASSCSN